MLSRLQSATSPVDATESFILGLQSHEWISCWRLMCVARSDVLCLPSWESDGEKSRNSSSSSCCHKHGTEMEDILISKVGGYSFFFYLKLQSLSCHGFFHVNLAVWFSSVTQLIPAFLVLDKSTGCVAVNMESSYVIQRLIKALLRNYQSD